MVVATEVCSPLAELEKAFVADPNKIGHLALLPAGETIYNDVIIRYFPGEHHLGSIPEPTPDRAQDYIDAAQTQFEVLRGFGIAVPNVFYAHESPDAPTTRIIGISPYVTGEKFSTEPAHWKLLGPALAPHQEATLSLAEGLVSYYDWVLNSKPTPKLYFPDISKLAQYKIALNGQPTLIDTDPLMINPFGEVGIWRVYANLKDLSWWMSEIQTTGQDRDTLLLLQKQIKTLEKQCGRYSRVY